MKTFVTFGQVHRHNINGVLLDKDCVAVIEAETAEKGRKKAFELFGQKFCFEYSEKTWDANNMVYFPRGYIYLGEKI